MSDSFITHLIMEQAINEEYINSLFNLGIDPYGDIAALNDAEIFSRLHYNDIISINLAAMFGNICQKSDSLKLFKNQKLLEEIH